jgi:hypothetical protein
MEQSGEREDFIRRQYTEIAPIVPENERAALEAVRHGEQTDRNDVERILETYESRIFRMEKHDAAADAKRVLVSASEPLAFSTVRPILEAMKRDARVGGVTLLTDNLAGRSFEALHDPDFVQVRDPGKPVMAEIPGPFEIALVPVDPKNSPNAAVLYGGKSVFGAERLYFLASGWVGVGNTPLFEQNRRERMDAIDGIFVIDDLAKRIVHRQLPEYPEERIQVTGMPLSDAVGAENPELLAAAGRQKLGLGTDERAVLLLPHVSPAPDRPEPGVHPRISEDTFERSLTALVRVAEANPGRRYAVLVRPHPRDWNREEYFRIADRELPPNLRVLPATNDVVSMPEAAYAASVTASIAGTDNFIAPMRGRQGVFLAYREEGMGGDLLRRLYGEDSVEEFRHARALTVADDPEAFGAVVEESEPNPANPPPPKSGGDTSAQRILDRMLG